MRFLVMESLKDTDLESFTRLTQDIAKHKASAAKALKKFKIAYSEIMGCPSDDVSSEVQQFETETSELSSLSNTNDMPNVIHNKTLDNSTKSIHKTFNPLHVSQNNRCIYCRFITSPKVPYVPINKSWKFQNFDRRYWCYKCATSGDKVISSSDDEVSVICHNPISKPSEKRKTSVCKELCNNPIKVTVPEPFTMTVREESQKYTKELKIQKLKDEINAKIEKEMQIKIRSNPAPAHIYEPLYKKMMELSMTRKEMRREKSLERTKDIVRPFNISNPKQLRKSDSMPNLQVEGKSFLFKANPVPRSILSAKVSEKLKNDEIVRQTRIRQRAKETLTHSSIPFTSSESVKTKSVVKLKANKSSNSNVKSYKTEKNIKCGGNKKVVVDWDAKAKKIECQKEHNNPQIVNGVTHSERYKKFLKAQDKSLEHYIRVTQGSVLRENEIRKEIKERETNDMSTNIPHRKEIRRQIRKKLQDVISPNCQKDMEEKLKTYRKSRRQRQIEYEQELMEMRRRIAKQPLLLERQSATKLSQPEMKDKSTNTDTAHSEEDDGDNSGTLSSGLSLGSNDDNSSLEDSG